MNDSKDKLENITSMPDNDIKNGYVDIGGRRIQFSERLLMDRLKITLPDKFAQMEKRYVKAKYPAYNKKDAIILTNKDTTINFMFDFQDGTIDPEEMEEIRDHLLDMIKELHPAHVFLDKATIEHNGLKVAFFEIVTPSLDKNIYNFMYFFLVDEKLVIATFNCFDDEKGDWRPIIRQVIKSLHV